VGETETTGVSETVGVGVGVAELVTVGLTETTGVVEIVGVGVGVTSGQFVGHKILYPIIRFIVTP
jgi:hypothetical protein